MANLGLQNNNPGNLKDPTTGQFRVFPTPEAGQQALMADLQLKQSGGSSVIAPTASLSQFANVWAPSSDNNNPANYSNTLAAHLGVDPSTPINQIPTDKLAGAVQVAEGTSTPQTSPSPTVPGQLTHSQLIANINAMEQQGAKQPEIQGYLDSLKTQNSPVQAPSPTTPDSSLNGFQNAAGDITGGKQLAEGAGFALSGLGDTYQQLAEQNTQSVSQLLAQAKTYPVGDPRRMALAKEALAQSQSLVGNINQGMGLAPTDKQVIGSALQLPLTIATAGTLTPEAAAIPEAGSLEEAIAKNVVGGTAKPFLQTAAGKILSNTVLGAGIGGTSSMAQGGDIASGIGSGAILGGVGGAAGELISKLADYVPTRILQSALPQLANNPDALDSALTKMKFGSVASNLEDVQSRINSYSNQIKGFVTDPQFRDWNIGIDKTDLGNGKTTDGILASVRKQFGNSEMTDDQIIQKMKNLLPNDSALLTKLQKTGLNLDEANQLRELLDGKTFKQNVFDQPEVKAGKDLAAAFSNSIRSKVQATDPYLAKIFDQFHQEIYLRNALKRVSGSGGMVNGRDLLDPIIGNEFGGKKGLTIAAAFDWFTRQPGVKISAAKLLDSGVVQGAAKVAAATAQKGSVLGSAL